MTPEPIHPDGRPLARLTRRALFTAAVVAGCAACTSGSRTHPHSHPVLDTSHPFGTDPASDGTPVSGGTAEIALDRDARSFDNLIQGANGAAASVYDSLLVLDHNGEPKPYLAKSMTTPDRGATWLLELRPGVLFHDGTPLDANAVIYNIRRHQRTLTSPGHLYTQRIASMTAVGDHTVRFRLTRPTGAFPVCFAISFESGNLGTIGSPTAMEKYRDSYGSHPVGAGPFRFVSWVPGSKIQLRRFDGYWQKGLPRLDGIEFRPITDTVTIVQSVQNGDVDYMFGGYLDQLMTGSTDSRLNAFYGPGGGAEYLYLNHAKAPFNDRRMREAVIRAIDPKAMSAVLYQGAMLPADSIFPGDSEYYSRPAAAAWPGYDQAKARSLIAAYRSAGGDPDFVVSLPNSPIRRQFGEFVQAQFAAVGLRVTLAFYDLANFSATVIAAGRFQMSSTVTGPWANPYPNVSILLDSQGYRNYGKYHNPQVDALLDTAMSTTDAKERVSAYQQIQLLSTQDIAVAWYSRGYLHAIARKSLRGVVRDLGGELYTATMWKAPRQ